MCGAHLSSVKKPSSSTSVRPIPVSASSVTLDTPASAGGGACGFRRCASSCLFFFFSRSSNCSRATSPICAALSTVISTRARARPALTACSFLLARSGAQCETSLAARRPTMPHSNLTRSAGAMHLKATTAADRPLRDTRVAERKLPSKPTPAPCRGSAAGWAGSAGGASSHAEGLMGGLGRSAIRGNSWQRGNVDKSVVCFQAMGVRKLQVAFIGVAIRRPLPPPLTRSPSPPATPAGSPGPSGAAPRGSAPRPPSLGPPCLAPRARGGTRGARTC
jgi:hypothetical protein